MALRIQAAIDFAGCWLEWMRAILLTSLAAALLAEGEGNIKKGQADQPVVQALLNGSHDPAGERDAIRGDRAKSPMHHDFFARNLQEVRLNAVKAPEPIALDVRAALHAICSTGKGRCWYCDLRLPHAEEAVATAWDVQRIQGERIASIILVCPQCQREQRELRLRAHALAGNA
jgi:hypothetical protein